MNKFIIIGLGNPGEKYKQTRHNTGKRFVEAFANTEYRIPNTEWRQTQHIELLEHNQWILAKSKTYMNESGKAVIALLPRYHILNIQNSEFPPADAWSVSDWRAGRIQNLFIAHDDLDIPLGKFKIQFGKGPRLHNGVLSVEQALGTKEFWRVRIGIASKQFLKLKTQISKLKAITQNPKSNNIGEKYVLKRFTAEEKKILEAVFPEIREKLLEYVII